MKKNIFSMIATLVVLYSFFPFISLAQSDDLYKNHITGGYEMQSVKELQQELNDSTFSDSTNTETKKPESKYRPYGEKKIVRFNGGDTIYAVRIKKHPAELSRLCRELGIPADYKSRMTTIVLPLCMQGVVLFDKTTDPYFLEEDIIDLKKNHGANWDCFFYRGTDEQNAKLIRNLNANRNLFKDGKLVSGAYLHWKVIE